MELLSNTTLALPVRRAQELKGGYIAAALSSPLANRAGISRKGILGRLTSCSVIPACSRARLTRNGPRLLGVTATA